MYQNSTSQETSRFSRIFRFFGLSRDEGASYARIEDQCRFETFADQPDCGSYNEAFIMQQWTGNNPNH